MRLLLSSFGPSSTHDRALVEMAGKPLEELGVGYIENTYDAYDDQASLDEDARACAATDTASTSSISETGVATGRGWPSASAASTSCCSPAATRTTFGP